MFMSRYTAKMLTVLGLMLFPHHGLWGSEKAVIRLVDSIAVRAPEITLGEIATVESDDPHLKESLIHFVVGVAPQVGRSRLVSSYKIKSLLAKNGFDSAVIHGVQSTVVTEATVMRRDEIKVADDGFNS